MVPIVSGRRAHLSPEQVAEAREMYRETRKTRQIAAYFKVSPAVINAVLNRTGAYKGEIKCSAKPRRWQPPPLWSPPL
jgi:transposase